MKLRQLTPFICLLLLTSCTVNIGIQPEIKEPVLDEAQLAQTVESSRTQQVNGNSANDQVTTKDCGTVSHEFIDLSGKMTNTERCLFDSWQKKQPAKGTLQDSIPDGTIQKEIKITNQNGIVQAEIATSYPTDSPKAAKKTTPVTTTPVKQTCKQATLKPTNRGGDGWFISFTECTKT
ncbi:MAG: hypothetical protein WCP97_06100 [bacterium]